MTCTSYIRANNSGTLINPVRRARREAIKAAGGIRQFKKEEKRNQWLRKNCVANGLFPSGRREVFCDA